MTAKLLDIADVQPLKAASELSTTKNNSIISSFSRHVSTYEDNASVQSQAAVRLVDFFCKTDPLSEELLANDSVMEVGCGTGLLSKQLLRLFPNYEITFTDCSVPMLERCKTNLTSLIQERDVDDIHFQSLDANRPANNDKLYGAIFSSFTLQWLVNFEESLLELIRLLKPQGKLYMTIPCADSFPEWRAAAKLASVPCTANKLPTRDSLVSACRNEKLELVLEQYEIVQSHTDPIDFFRSLKLTGSSTCVSGASLRKSDFAKLLAAWTDLQKDGITSTFSVIQAQISKRSA